MEDMCFNDIIIYLCHNFIIIYMYYILPSINVYKYNITPIINNTRTNLLFLHKIKLLKYFTFKLPCRLVKHSEILVKNKYKYLII